MMYVKNQYDKISIKNISNNVSSEANIQSGHQHFRKKILFH